MPVLVVAEGREEGRPARGARKLDDGDAAPAGGFLPRLARLDDLAGRGNALDANELQPLDVPDDRDAKGALQLSLRCSSASSLASRSRTAGPWITFPSRE
jgi:hypothetical protein